jgi:RNA polymerase sigma-70 factor (ECF subfamily)
MFFILLAIASEEELIFINKLYVKHNKEFYNIAMSILQNKNDAQDAVQESYLKIIDNIQKINKLSCPETIPYCVVIVKNASRDILRKRSKLVFSEDLEFLHDEETPDAEDEYVKKAQTKAMLDTLDALQDKDRAIIRLRYGNGFSYKKIGELLEMNESAVNKRTQRALLKLRDIMTAKSWGGV